jgi:chemotaxis protein methyltransferase CheR
MTAELSGTLMAELSGFVEARLGLHFPRERGSDLERGARAASQECGFEDDVVGFVGKLLSAALTQSELEILSSHLTIGETYFFREKNSLEAFEQQIVPELIRTRDRFGGQLRIWSAGCASGEEPYSLAIILSKMITQLKAWKITILATDLNTRALHKASEGTYTDWSFRESPSWLKGTYFRATPEGRWAISPAIKKMVTFSYLNLVEDVYPSLLTSTNAMDVIFCRNVLMYFAGPAREKVIHRFHRSLAEQSWLIVSPTETSQTLFSEFATVSLPGVTLYRKGVVPPQMVIPSFFQREHEARAALQAAHRMLAEPESIKHANLDLPLTPPQPQAGVALSPEIEIPAEEALELYQQGRYEEAARLLIAQVSANANNAPAMLLLARVYANQGKLKPALGWCEKAIAVDKLTACAHYLRATILLEQGLPEEAIGSLRRAVYVDTRFALGHFALGSLALRQGDVKESERHFNNVLWLLASYGPEEIVPESEGLSARRLREIVSVQRSQEAAENRTPAPTRTHSRTRSTSFSAKLVR